MRGYLFRWLLLRLLRLIGVGVLFVLGQLKRKFDSSATAYSLKALYYMDYGNKPNEYDKMMERAGQQMAGLMFLFAVVATCVLIGSLV